MNGEGLPPAASRVSPEASAAPNPRRLAIPWCLTKRLALSEITADDGNELHELDTDPRVMQYIGSGRLSTREQIDDALRRIPRAYLL